MRRFINRVLICGAILALLAACGTTGSVKQRGTSSRNLPVPVSAALQGEFDKALGLMKRADYVKAIPALEAIIAKNDRLPGPLINLAIAYMKSAPDDKQSMLKAEKAMQSALTINSKNPTAHQQLGLLYRMTGRFSEAKRSYQTAIKLKPDYALAHRNLGILCDIYLQDFKCAVKHFEEYRTLSGDVDGKVKLWLSEVRRRGGIPEPPPPPSEATAISEAKQ